MTLSPQQLHALAVASKGAKSVRSKLKAGTTTKIDCTIRLQGELVVGHPSTYVTPKPTDAKKLIELLLAEFGPRKRVEIVGKLIAAITVSKKVKPTKKAKKAEPVDAALTEQVDRLIAGTTSQATVTQNGAVTGVITATIVEAE